MIWLNEHNYYLNNELPVCAVVFMNESFLFVLCRVSKTVTTTYISTKLNEMKMKMKMRFYVFLNNYLFFQRVNSYFQEQLIIEHGLAQIYLENLKQWVMKSV